MATKCNIDCGGSSRLFVQKHLCIEYVVTRSLDGSSPSPEIDFAVAPGNEDNIYRPDPVANLGLITPEIGEGPRIIDWFWLRLPSAAPGACAMFLYDPVSGSRMESEQSFAGQSNIYRKNTNIYIPTGSELQITGFPAGSASAASPIRLRLGISIPDQQALMESLAADLDLAGYAPDNKSVRVISADTTLDVDATYSVVDAPITVTLPPSSEAFFWGQSFGGVSRRIGRRYELDIRTSFSAQVAPSPGDTINGSAEPITVSNFVIIQNLGTGDWRLHDLEEVP
jgi:hypothetical protein